LFFKWYNKTDSYSIGKKKQYQSYRKKNLTKKIFLKSKNIRCAINHQIVNKNGKIKNKDEIAFFPPFTGG